METQKNAKTIEGSLPKSVGGTGAGNWNIDGDSYQFVPGKMENCDLVKFDDAGNKVVIHWNPDALKSLRGSNGI